MRMRVRKIVCSTAFNMIAAISVTMASLGAQARSCSEDQVIKSFNHETNNQYSKCLLETDAAPASKNTAVVMASCEKQETHRFSILLDSECQVSRAHGIQEQ